VGQVNDRILIRTTGLVYTTSVNQSRTTLGHFGTVGTLIANIAFSGSDMLFQVEGATNMKYQLELHP
jgi:hypothetical protein